MKIDMAKKYHLRDDDQKRPVQIFGTDCGTLRPVIGMDHELILHTWTESGEVNEDFVPHGNDLIEIREPREPREPRVLWVNETKSGLHHNHHLNHSSALASERHSAPVKFVEVMEDEP